MKSNWSTPAQIRALLQKRWESQKLLKLWIKGELNFPYTLPLKKPGSKQLSEQFREVKQWISLLHKASADYKKDSYQIRWQQIRHRQLGPQKTPQSVYFSTAQALFGFIGQKDAFMQFLQISTATIPQWPATQPVFSQQPLKLLALAKQWPELLAVLSHFEKNSRPNCYLRQLSIPGVDTKFIENNKRIINDLLLLILPREQIDRHIEGIQQHGFERRFGLLYEEPLIRFRILDERLSIKGLDDLSLPLSQFKTLKLAVNTIFITENKVNGLAFPSHPSSIVIFGLGYGIQSLLEATWLQNTLVYYWGDIDTHGFSILSRLRRIFPQTQSMLMDESTLLDCKSLWVREPEQTQETLENLSQDEHRLYRQLIENNFDKQVRLEQERVPFELLRITLDRV